MSDKEMIDFVISNELPGFKIMGVRYSLQTKMDAGQMLQVHDLVAEQQELYQKNWRERGEGDAERLSAIMTAVVLLVSDVPLEIVEQLDSTQRTKIMAMHTEALQKEHEDPTAAGETSPDSTDSTDL